LEWPPLFLSYWPCWPLQFWRYLGPCWRVINWDGVMKMSECRVIRDLSEPREYKSPISIGYTTIPSISGQKTKRADSINQLKLLVLWPSFNGCNDVNKTTLSILLHLFQTTSAQVITSCCIFCCLFFSGAVCEQITPPTVPWWRMISLFTFDFHLILVRTVVSYSV